jgi:serine/threonine-protein kinase
LIGRVLTRYKILEEVGQGGMAVVYKGLDTSLGREVAVKVLHPHLAAHQESRARLEREAQAVAKLRHENILEIFDYSGSDSTESFIVTEFIHGPTLTAFLKDHPIELPEVAAMIASEVARALEHAHGLGVIHRDVKPENVMIAEGGLLKLTDFGIAQIVDKERMTVTGQLLGSPAYMSPELVEGGRLDFRTDVFACGILLYQLATGVLPFRGKNPHEVLKKIAECQFQPPDQVNPLVSSGLAKIISRALSRSPEARHPDVGIFRSELCAELATVGVEDVRAELKGFFASPKEWTASFRPKLIAALIDSGKKLADRGRSSAALGAWGRVLTLEPSHAEARALIDSIGQRRRTARIAAVVGGALVVAGAITLGLHFILPSLEKHPDGGAPIGKVVAPPEPKPLPPTVITPDPKSPAPAPIVAPVAFHPRPIAPHPSPPRIEAPRRVSLNVVQKNVTVSVDGKPLGAYDGPFEVSAGEHDLVVRNDLCEDFRTRLTATQTLVDDHGVPIKLKWKPGSLNLVTDPDGADVTWRTEFDNSDASHPPAQGGRQLRVTIPPNTDDGEMKVYLTVQAHGYHSAETVCPAKAGRVVPCKASLQKVE